MTNVRVRYADLSAARLSLTGQVARAWFAAVESQRQLDLAQISLDSFGLSSGPGPASVFKAGLRPALDLRLALAEVARAEANVERWAEIRDRTTRQLETLMGRYPSADYLLAARLPDVPSTIPGHLPSALIHRRPDLVSAEMNLLAVDARLAQAKADLRPRFSLTGSAGTASDTLLDVVDNDLFIWSFVGSLVQPLFRGGRLRATVDRNQSAAEEALATYESRVLQGYREVESALSAEEALRRRETGAPGGCCSVCGCPGTGRGEISAGDWTDINPPCWRPSVPLIHHRANSSPLPAPVWTIVWTFISHSVEDFNSSDVSFRFLS